MMRPIALSLITATVLTGCYFGPPHGWRLETHTECLTIYLENINTGKIDTLKHVTSVSMPGDYGVYSGDSCLATYPSENFIMRHAKTKHEPIVKDVK